MVHVLTTLLHTVHQSLRTDGLLLLFQPATAHKIIELTVEGRVLLKEELEENNFMEYMVATHTALQNVLSDRLFIEADKAITPSADLYNCHEFESIDIWAKDYSWLSDDPEVLDVFAAKMRLVADGRVHRVCSYSQDYEVLLRKG